MILNELDVTKLSKLISQQTEYVTCFECCKTYTVPTTAVCGHTLCHACWRVRNTCPFCRNPVDKKRLTLNLPLQTLTNHEHNLKDSFEELFKIKLDEFLIDVAADIGTDKDPNKNVKDWLASSQNHFSAPVTNSQQLSQESNTHVEQVMSEIQVHTENKKLPSPVKIIHIPQEQKDWDKIEVLPDSENIVGSNVKENIIGPMDIEPFDSIMEDDEFSVQNPRRSSRNRESKNSNSYVSEKTSNKSNNQTANTIETNKRVQKPLKPWNNIKRMRKEFSKLNKQNKSKLNVSIEMCKKTKNPKSDEIHEIKNISLDIDDNTPNIILDKVIPEDNEEEIIKQSDYNKMDAVEQPTLPVNKNIRLYDKENITKHTEGSNIQKVCFFKKSALQSNSYIKKPIINIDCKEESKVVTSNPDDIEITIKVGKTVTNICIKKKESDVELKVHTDQEIQTSLNKPTQNNKVNVSCSPYTHEKDQGLQNVSVIKNNSVAADVLLCNDSKADSAGKPASVKKNTESAETTTAQYEITESVEKELSTTMENISHQSNKTKNLRIDTLNRNIEKNTQVAEEKLINDIEELNELDIFDSQSVKEANVQPLMDTKQVPSAILRPTTKSLKDKINSSDKRLREDENEFHVSKKMKVTDVSKVTENQRENIDEQDSELGNYDAIISQVFANIEADMAKPQNPHPKTQNQNTNISKESQKLPLTNKSYLNRNKDLNKTQIEEKFSENVFSLIEKENEITIEKADEIPMISQHGNQKNENSKSNEVIMRPSTQGDDMEMVELSTPVLEDMSDHSVVEETPQKDSSFSKIKNKNEVTTINIDSSQQNTQVLFLNKKHSSLNAVDPEKDDENVINLTDTLQESLNKTSERRNSTIIDALRSRMTLETPQTINKFVDHIKHKSTPVARKSLNFNNNEDPEETLCPSLFAVAKTTQEREFMSKAFNQSISPLSARNKKKEIKYCVAGSCLTPLEQAKVKSLCMKWNWIYVDKYVKELTHLVVGVDEENKSQRSVKYMCALAAAKWIISYEWVEKCLMTNTIVNEEPFEAIDGTGEPGPKRSRLAKKKLFQGITFYCMPPFSVLDVDTLKEILENAGGRVVDEAKAVRASEQPALLLAEPEHTQEHKFTYLAMQLTIVPVNYEWVLNCLGSYTLGSIYDLLLCPPPLLPAVTSKWPPELISRDSE